MPGPPAQETVIVVHGTFSGKVPDARPGWYAPGETFCKQLDKELEARGSSARCWQHLQSGEDYFHWDGANDWLSRFKAAAQLRQQLQLLRDRGWTAHLVGHSHGGNVIIDAITNHYGRVESWFCGRVALLGTPLYRESPAFFRRRQTLTTRWTVASLVAWGVLLYVSARQVDVLAGFAHGTSTEYWATAVSLVLGMATVVLVVRVVTWLTSKYLWLYLWTQLWMMRLLPSRAFAKKSEERWSPPFMLINSQFDEAYRSLSGLQQGANPLISTESPSKSGFASNVGAVAESGWSRLATLIGSTLDTPHAGALTATGAASVLVLLLWKTVLYQLSPAPLSTPGLSLGFWVVVTTIVVAACFLARLVFLPGILLTEGLPAMWRGLASFAALSFDVRIRKSVWASMKSLGMGLSGAPQRVEDIIVSLTFDESDPEDCVYVELPEDIVSGVTQAQKGRLTEIQEILYRRRATWSPTHLREELESVDFPLVHTAYYRHSECIQKIADWMCEPRVKELDGRLKYMTTVTVGKTRGGLLEGFKEEIEGVNAYRKHVEELKQRHAPRGSKWGTGTNVTPST
jgi:hypothetical protein